MAFPYNLHNPNTLSKWIKESGFPLDKKENNLLLRVEHCIYQDQLNVIDLNELRVLYWQVMGWMRK